MDTSNLFKKRLEQLGIKKQVDASMIVEEAQQKIIKIFGKKAEGNLEVVSYSKGVLKIATKSSAWANECQGHLLELQKEPIKRVIFINGFNHHLQ